MMRLMLKLVPWRWLVAGVLCGLFPLMMGQADAQNTASAVRPQVRLFPGVAAPGDLVWVIGAPRGVEREGRLWVGGQSAAYTTEPTSGWLRFTVPTKAGGGPQSVQFADPGFRTSLRLSLTVLPAEAASQDTVLYAPPQTLAGLQKTYRERLDQLSSGCQRSCPPELTATIQRLSALRFPALKPLVPGRRQVGTTFLPGPRVPTLPPSARLRPQLKLENLIRPLPVQPRQGNFCGQLAGILPTAGLPTGQVISLLTVLFGDDLGIDPSTSGHPAQAQAPYQNGPPAQVIQKFLDGPTGSGKGVVIHVLDTASNMADPFVMQQDVNYYNQPYQNRPFHGSIAGQVAQTVAPAARLDYRQVCDKNGECSTLEVVQALCAVAEGARQGGKHVVSFSVGGAYPAWGLQLALREVAAAGVPTAASYGNRDDCAGLVEGDRCNHYPADWSASFAVSRVRNAPTLLLSVAGWDVATMQMATYNRGMLGGGFITPPPGVQAPGEFWFGGLPYFGSSFAAPVVAGVLANWMTCKPGVPYLPFVNTPGQLPLPQSVVRACP